MKTMNELVSWFQLEYPELVSDMKAANHHFTANDKIKIEVPSNFIMSRINGDNIIESINPYHNESDVFTHTMMVCKQAENAPYEVQIAALLHDIGKPSARAVNPKNGRVSFFNHDAVSAFMSLEILKRKELGLSKGQKIHIFNMIALHTQVFKLTKQQIEAAYTNKPGLIDDFIELGRHDSNGRFASIPTETKTEGDFWANTKICDKKEKEVIVLCGLPGSGKSTWVTENTPNHYIVSRDEVLESSTEGNSYSEKWKNADQNLINTILQGRYSESKNESWKGKVVVDMTHMSKKSRRKSLSHFGSEYKKKCVVFLPDMQTLNLQNENRCGKVIGREVIEKMMRSFYPLTFEEFDEIEYVI